MNVKLIVGLGNPGEQYNKTRHNAGAWFVETLAQNAGVSLRAETKFQGMYGQIIEGEYCCHLLIPTTFMNRSGQAVHRVANFYKIPSEAILVAHDDLDLSVGTVRLKLGGGHGGHNGLRDIIHSLSDQFLRLRFGIGHPGHKDHVLDYVLSRPSRSDADQIYLAIDSAISVLPLLLAGDIPRAMQSLHTATG